MRSCNNFPARVFKLSRERLINGAIKFPDSVPFWGQLIQSTVNLSNKFLYEFPIFSWFYLFNFLFYCFPLSGDMFYIWWFICLLIFKICNFSLTSNPSCSTDSYFLSKGPFSWAVYLTFIDKNTNTNYIQ